MKKSAFFTMLLHNSIETKVYVKNGYICNIDNIEFGVYKGIYNTWNVICLNTGMSLNRYGCDTRKEAIKDATLYIDSYKKLPSVFMENLKERFKNCDVVMDLEEIKRS